MIVYCSIGWRSSALAQRLQAAGFTNVANLHGSLFAWAAEGRPLESNGAVARVVHPYSPQYGFLLPARLVADIPAVEE